MSSAASLTDLRELPESINKREDEKSCDQDKFLIPSAMNKVPKGKGNKRTGELPSYDGAENRNTNNGVNPTDNSSKPAEQSPDADTMNSKSSK